jgi:hypothetical protein
MEESQVKTLGHYYYFYCRSCKVYFFLGKETEWPYDHEKMYCFKDFLLEHCDHDLTVGGDSWNCAYSVIHFPTEHAWDFREKGWKAFDDSASKLDYADEHKRERKP